MPRPGSLIERLWNLFADQSGTKVVAVIIAIVLWAVVLGSRNFELTKDIPLEVITPADVVPSNDIPDRISFRLSGPKAFLRGILDRREEPIRVNLSGAKPALVTYPFFADNIRVPIGVKVLSINPSAVLIKLEYVKSKEIPVRLELRGTPPEGYRIVKAEIKPSLVRIRGAESRINRIAEVATLPIDLSQVTHTVEKEAQIDGAPYKIQLDGEMPRVFIQVEALSANFRMKNVDIHVLSPYKSKLEEKSITVLVRASPDDLKDLDPEDVFGVVDLNGKEKGKYRESVRVSLPKNIGLVKVIPDSVHVLLY